MGLASIYLPKKFRDSHPSLYKQLIENTNRFTSTFDLHETIKFLSRLRHQNETKDQEPRVVPKIAKNQKVGKTLFEEIPRDRSCVDAKVPINFCVCMEPLEDPMDLTGVKVRKIEFE